MNSWYAYDIIKCKTNNYKKLSKTDIEKFEQHEMFLLLAREWGSSLTSGDEVWMLGSEVPRLGLQARVTSREKVLVDILFSIVSPILYRRTPVFVSRS